MKTEDKKVDDHHCSVIEKDIVEKELAECDANYYDPEGKKKCHDAVVKNSAKRERACKYS